MAVVGTAKENHGQQYEDGIGVTGGVTRVFFVHTDDAQDSGFIVRNASGLPLVGESHPEDPSYIVQRRTAQRAVDPGLSWVVTCEYGRSKNPSEDDNPFNEPVRVSYRSNSQDVPLIVDLEDNPVLCSNACPYLDPVIVTRAHPVWVFVRNEPNDPSSIATSYVDHVNNGTYLGKPTGTIKCTDIDGEKQFQSNQPYWEVTYTFSYRVDGWQPAPLNHGFMELSGGAHIKIKDSEGRDISEPRLLDANGAKLSAAASFTSASYGSFVGYNTANFGALGLPT